MSGRPVVQVRRLPHHDGLPLPARQTAGSAGYDVCSAEDATLQPLERKLLKTGLALAIPAGYEAQVRPRSGLAVKYGLTLPKDSPCPTLRRRSIRIIAASCWWR